MVHGSSNTRPHPTPSRTLYDALNTCSGQLSHHVQTVYQNDARLTLTRRHLQSILSIP
ncbi:hypothetical protein QIS74_09738 [Colletotrichum tabaci]|uniref:Uncharacterized protein n=1 Tax=Colletotrichum tabaci TaxID=1209068 RepID=A0AAV9T649_9PEZI